MKSVADVPSPEDDDSEDPEPALLFEDAGSSSAALPAMEAGEEEAEGELRGGNRNRKHSPDTGTAAPIDPISDLAVAARSSPSWSRGCRTAASSRSAAIQPSSR